MRSFQGRDILSLKDFERNEFFHVFEVAKALEPIARSRRNSDMLKEKTLVTAFYQPSTRTRLAHMLNQTKNVKDKDYFYFTTFNQVNPETILQAPIWRRADRDELVPLIFID